MQIALITERIRHLTEHLKDHKKDCHSRRGMVALTNRRRKLLSYLRKRDANGYQSIIKELNLRK